MEVLDFSRMIGAMSLHALGENIAILWRYLSISTTMQLYVASIIVLVFGLVYEVWMRSMRLSGLEEVSLKAIEKTHPHLPSIRAIIVTFVCGISLSIVALQTLTGLTPFSNPNEWTILASFFIVCGAFGLLAETRWKGASDDAFACITGTALAFLFTIIRSTILLPSRAVLSTLLISALVLLLALAWTMLLRHWTVRVRIITFVVFALWVFLLWFL